MKVLSILLTALTLSGCTGKILTTKNPPLSDGKPVEGVIYYGYKTVDKKSVLDRIRHPKTGDITHSMYAAAGSPGYCEPSIVIDQVAVADFSTPYLINYKPDFFESRKFSVTLHQGMLASVNSESTPGPKAAVESLQGLASLREDVLNGIQEHSDSTGSKVLSNVLGTTPASVPIKCSAKE